MPCCSGSLGNKLVSLFVRSRLKKKERNKMEAFYRLCAALIFALAPIGCNRRKGPSYFRFDWSNKRSNRVTSLSKNIVIFFHLIFSKRKVTTRNCSSLPDCTRERERKKTLLHARISNPLLFVWIRGSELWIPRYFLNWYSPWIFVTDLICWAKISLIKWEPGQMLLKRDNGTKLN